MTAIHLLRKNYLSSFLCLEDILGDEYGAIYKRFYVFLDYLFQDEYSIRNHLHNKISKANTT